MVGLTTAVRLAERGWRVRVWTAAPATATTSAVAAAIWYPYRVEPPELVLAWARRTFAVLAQLATEPAWPVWMADGLELSRTPLAEPWWAAAVPDLRHADPAELPPGYADGFALRVPAVHAPRYLLTLAQRAAAASVTLEQRRVRDLDEALAANPVVVNCAGVAAGQLAGDATVTPIRGQVVRVVDPGLERFLLDEDHPESVTYVVPRGQDVVCGGTADVGRWQLEPDPEVADAILRRCRALEPRLAGMAVLGHAVGLRPGRPALRLEAEDRGAGRVVVHHYGHGGAGFTLSWGCADAVADLLG